MNRTAIAFLTRDRVELSRQTVEPLLQPDKFDLFWMDGSQTLEGQNLPSITYKSPLRIFYTKQNFNHYGNVKGGADAAIVYALTTMLNARPKNLHLSGVSIGSDSCYDFVGICENDVLLDSDWFAPTTGLFIRGAKDGLAVGAVSARAYEDRVLIQRDGYAVMHNLGAGMVIFTREAAQLILDNYRTGMTQENRGTFAMLAGIDIGTYWAFRQSDHWITGDWTWDRILAEHGLASLALTSCKATMIGQDPPLEQQGLRLVRDSLPPNNEEAHERFCRTTADIRTGALALPSTRFHRDAQGYTLIFPHQLPQIGGSYSGDWTLKWSQGFGPFVWRANTVDAHEAYSDASGACPAVTVPVSGPCELLFLGGPYIGSMVEIAGPSFLKRNLLEPEDTGKVLAIEVPETKYRREITARALTPGIRFYGLRTRDPQPWLPNVHFDHATLPPIGG